jgi:hypothetical protein
MKEELLYDENTDSDSTGYLSGESSQTQNEVNEFSDKKIERKTHRQKSM